MPLRIVTDPWPPYSIADGEQLRGADVDIVQVVMQQLQIPIKFIQCPWKRCVSMVMHGQADAILDISLNAERQQQLEFPEEPVSIGTTTFFVRKDRPLRYRSLSELDALSAGVISGYSYCDVIDQSEFFKRAEPGISLEQNFKRLLSERIDFLVEVDAVGFYTAKNLGIRQQIEAVPQAQYCRGGNYLAFAKGPDAAATARRFAEALSLFKHSQMYLEILEQYGLEKRF